MALSAGILSLMEWRIFASHLYSPGDPQWMRDRKRRLACRMWEMDREIPCFSGRRVFLLAKMAMAEDAFFQGLIVCSR